MATDDSQPSAPVVAPIQAIYKLTPGRDQDGTERLLLRIDPNMSLDQMREFAKAALPNAILVAGAGKRFRVTRDFTAEEIARMRAARDRKAGASAVPQQ